MQHGDAKPLTAQDIGFRKIISIAAPMIVAYISVPFTGIVDMAVVGHLDDSKYIDGVAVGAVFFSTTYFIFFFLRWSTTGLVAQLFGKLPSDEVSHAIGETLARAMLFGLLISVIVIALHRPLLSLVLDIMNSDPGVRAQALAYSARRVMGAPAVLLSFALTGWFIGAAEARAVLAMTVLSNVLNAALSVLFVFRLGMTADGSGLAAAVGDWGALALGTAMFLKAQTRFVHRLSLQRILDREKVMSLLTANAQIATKLVSTIAVMYGLMVTSGRFGPVTLAANALILQLFYLGSYVLDGFANACEALAGRAYGARDYAVLRLVIARCSLCALAVGGFFFALYLIAGREIIDLMSNLPDVRAAASAHLIWAALLPPGMALAVMYEGVFVGTMRTAALRNCALIGTAIFFLLLWPAVTFGGNHGLWFAFLVYFLSRQIVSYLVYLRRMTPERWQVVR